MQAGVLRPDQIDEETRPANLWRELAPVDLVLDWGEHRIITFAWANCLCPYFTDVLWPDFDEQAFECAALLIESVARRYRARVMTKPDGGCFARYRLISVFGVNTRGHRCAFIAVSSLLLRWLSVCRAAWEWGQLRFLPRVHSGLAGGAVWFVIGATKLFLLLPEYHNIRQPLVEMSLWASLDGGLSRYCCAIFIPVRRQSGATQKHCVPGFRFVNYCAIFLGHAGAARPAP